MTETQPHRSLATRRGVLLGAGALGAGAIVAACGHKEPSVGEPTSTPFSATTSVTAGDVKASEVPVGSGNVFKDMDFVVTQPQAGQFKAFSATCTHRGCTVSDVTNGTINCPCHGSKFNMTDGSVVHGPATLPLSQKAVTVNDETLTIT